STQILQRDLHAEYFTTLALIGSSLDKFATEIRHLQRTEVSEAAEFFSAGQKGSSAMPHKQNPILSENISGLARILRGNALAAMENVALWHERDISHSSVERVIGPDSTTLLDFMLVRFTGLIKNLLVYPEKMLANMNITRGIFFSQKLLLELTRGGMTREDAYRLVQKNALQAWKEQKDFIALVQADPEITRVLAKEEIAASCDIRFFFQHVDEIFKRVFAEG
ncbi:MAG: lyase family protein, partial [Proteobacteria bacterium]|nr:lyase family protein [Pseudomonadota bacterium]